MDTDFATQQIRYANHRLKEASECIADALQMVLKDGMACGQLRVNQLAEALTQLNCAYALLENARDRSPFNEPAEAIDPVDNLRIRDELTRLAEKLRKSRTPAAKGTRRGSRKNAA